MKPPLIFLDTETLGLGLNHPIWEIGLIRREPDGAEVEHHFFVEHDPALGDPDLPESFKADYAERYDSEAAYPREGLIPVLQRLFRDRPHVVGAVPNFDTERIAHQLGVSGWHYHLIDVENLAVGYLIGKGRGVPGLPWDSDELSAAVGIDPARYKRHTALDDARWARDIYDRITKGAQA